MPRLKLNHVNKKRLSIMVIMVIQHVGEILLPFVVVPALDWYRQLIKVHPGGNITLKTTRPGHVTINLVQIGYITAASYECHSISCHGQMFSQQPVQTSYKYISKAPHPWWRHQMETLSALLAICVGTSSVSGEFPVPRPVTRSFDVFFDMLLNKLLSKHS